MSGTAFAKTPTPSNPESVADNVAGMGAFLIDPAGAARRVFHKWFWVGPWILMAIVAFAGSYFTLPLVQHVLDVAPTPPGTDPAAAQKGAEMGMKIGTIAMYAAPVTTLLLFCIQAAILFGMTTVLSVKATFVQMLNLVAGCSIIQVLATVAGVLILRTKNDISTMAELRPALGLDIFMPEGANKFLLALLGYFSIFEIWWLIMITLVLSAAFRLPKTKALLLVSPIFVISLIFRLAGAAFART